MPVLDVGNALLCVWTVVSGIDVGDALLCVWTVVSGIGHSGIGGLGALDRLSAHAAGRARKDVVMAASSSWSNVDPVDEAQMRKCEGAAMEAIKSGQLVFSNGDGTYRCPFCPSKGKKAYKHNDIYSHAAKRVMSRSRTSESRGQHRALRNILHQELMQHAEHITPQILEFLEEELRQRAAMIAPGVVKILQPAPKRVRPDSRMVHPWVGIICNLNTLEPNLQRMLPGSGDLRDHLSHFQAVQVKTLWADNGLQGVAVLLFGLDMKAYANCRSFEASFQAVQRGRSDWERCKAAGREGTDPDLYGWMAVEEDYYDGGEAGHCLRNNFQLTTMHDVVEEKMKTIRIQQLKLNSKKDEVEGPLEHMVTMHGGQHPGPWIGFRVAAEPVLLSFPDLDTQKFKLSNSLFLETEQAFSEDSKLYLLEHKTWEERLEADEWRKSGKHKSSSSRCSQRLRTKGIRPI